MNISIFTYLNHDTEPEYDIFLVGTGGTGSQLLPFLCQLANKFGIRLTIIDGDHFSKKNVSNQKCISVDEGLPKVQVLAERYQNAYPNLKIRFVDSYIENVNQLFDIIYGSHEARDRLPILIGCVDNNATRKIFDEFFFSEQVPDLVYIDSGNGTNERYGQVVVGYKKGFEEHVAPYNSVRMGRKVDKIIYPPVGTIYPIIRKEDKKIIDVVSCEEAAESAPQNIATNILAASTVFCVVNNLIAFNKIEKNLYYFNAEKGEVISRELKYVGECFDGNVNIA